jgi:hypothetical protein
MGRHISISPRAEAKLREQAAAAGQPVEAVAARIVEDAVEGTNGVHSEDMHKLPPDEVERRRRSLREWDQSARTAGQPVDDTRESIYREREG